MFGYKWNSRLYKKQKNGLVFKDNSVASLSKCIEKCISKNDLTKFKNNINNNNIPEYSYENFYKKFCNVIKSRYYLK